MNSTSATAIILSSLSQYGSAILIILGAVIGLALGYLVFRFGWFQVKKSTDTGAHKRGRNSKMFMKDGKTMQRINGKTEVLPF